MSFHWTFLSIGLFWSFVLPAACADEPDEKGVDFVKQIQPLFKKHCYECHGSETREAGLRLDQKAAALAGGDNGKVILPKQAGKSLLIELVSGNDPDRVMPPDDPLSSEQVQLLRAWIDAGAAWPDGVDPQEAHSDHWAFQPLRVVDPETLPTGGTAIHPIDAFVRARLQEAGLSPSPPADRYTLIKRLYYDLLGLPPSPEAADRFVRDSSPDAYERLVDELLASPHFGERWGRHWLDKARYADSDGYEKDRPRFHAWKYRDWVIQAINDDMPFDQFTIEQIAGDLIENASPSQKLATAFHRQTLTNTEGGTDQEEFRCAAIFDRVETIGTVWLGLTIGCARCHSHKYDPIMQREYYELFAFFNNGDEVTMEIPSSPEAQARYETEYAQWKQELAKLQTPYQAARERLREAFASWEQEQRARLSKRTKQPVRYVNLQELSAVSEAGAKLTPLKDGSYLAGGKRPKQDVYRLTGRIPMRDDSTLSGRVTGFRLEVLPDPSLPKKGPGWADNGNFVLSEITVDLQTAEKGANRRLKFVQAVADFSQQGFDVAQAIDGKEDSSGWAIASTVGQRHLAWFLLSEEDIATLNGVEQATVSIRLSQQYDKPQASPHPLGRFRVEAMIGYPVESLGLPEAVRKALAVDPEQRGDQQKAVLFDYFTKQDPEVQRWEASITAHKKKEPFNPKMTVRVIQERKNNVRQTHVFKRGSFLDPLEPVEPDTLDILPPLPEGSSGTRLDLARWLVSAENPLTPRVTVNHIWSHLFGEGLVRTVNDFGVRGERPTHPELLDWLAAEFLRLRWSRKALIKRILMSETYRQSSAIRPADWERDPENHLLGRQNRFRVEGEIVRDLFLAVSDLLDRRIGGPSVFPPLPAGVASLSYANNFKWGQSEWNNRPDRPGGIAPRDDIHRRGMYTFFKRTAAHPNLMTFDCPDSNTTCVKRSLSNTPLQVLVTLNNDVFLEAARALAVRVLRSSGESDEDRLSAMFRFCLVRPPTSDELRTMSALLEDTRQHYRQHPQAASDFAGKSLPSGMQASELAAWVAVARIIVNLDEFMTRE